GTDMAIGKMSTSLELHRAALNQGIKAQFMATGQAGIAIAGQGIALDAVRVDFAVGAVEQTVRELAADQDLVIIEGQGSLLHPGSTATLPLIRGSQPTALVLVHRAGATHIRDFANISIPPLTEVIQLYETVASAFGAFGQVKVKAIALNTLGMDTAEAKAIIKSTAELTGLPCSDVVRFGGARLLSAVYAK
ncbi:MAG: NAD-dependent epimerase/dehydratase family protein, partial [Waterburya sp.]